MMKKKQRGRRNTESSPALSPPILPDDLIVEILLRLPVRSLVRFKSVGKSCLSLISSPQFGKSHFDLAAAPTHRCLVKIDDLEFESLDVADSSSFHDVVNVGSPRYNCNFYVEHVQILGSCRGFVLLLYPGGALVWNPST